MTGLNDNFHTLQKKKTTKCLQCEVMFDGFIESWDSSKLFGVRACLPLVPYTVNMQLREEFTAVNSLLFHLCFKLLLGLKCGPERQDNLKCGSSSVLVATMQAETR